VNWPRRPLHRGLGQGRRQRHGGLPGHRAAGHRPHPARHEPAGVAPAVLEEVVEEELLLLRRVNIDYTLLERGPLGPLPLLRRRRVRVVVGEEVVPGRLTVALVSVALAAAARAVVVVPGSLAGVLAERVI
jgi:hypothetical protein